MLRTALPILFLSPVAAYAALPATQVHTAAQHRSVTFNVDQRELVFEVQPFSARSADFKLLVQVSPRQIVEFPAPPPTTVRGVAFGSEDMTLVGSVANGAFHGTIIDRSAGEKWTVTADENYEHATVSLAEPFSFDGMCGVTDVNPDATPAPNGNQSSRFVGGRLVELLVDTDVEYFSSNGSSVLSTLADIDAIVNSTSAIYETELNLTIQLETAVVRTTAAGTPYPPTMLDSSDLLNRCRTNWLNVGDVDIVHLFSGRNFSDGNTIGRAYLGDICGTLARGVNNMRTNASYNRSELLAHEIGHNFDLNHCNSSPQCGIMCSNISSCNAGATFSASEEAQIRNFADNSSCTTYPQGPRTVPATDSSSGSIFGSIDSSFWVSTAEADISGVNSPTGLGGMLTIQVPSPIGTQNNVLIPTLTSNEFLLGNFVSAQLNLNMRYRDPNGSATGAITVEGMDQSGVWQFLDVITRSDNQPTFSTSVTIPPALRHDKARLRIRDLTSQVGVAWSFVDASVTGMACQFLTQELCPAQPNSVSMNGGQLGLQGPPSITNTTIYALNMPTDTLCYLVAGTTTQSPVPYADGTLCISGQVVRFPSGQTNSTSGWFFTTFDATNLPNGGGIFVGDSLYFQAFYRDTTPGGGNLSESLRVRFCQ